MKLPADIQRRYNSLFSKLEDLNLHDDNPEESKFPQFFNICLNSEAFTSDFSWNIKENI